MCGSMADSVPPCATGSKRSRRCYGPGSQVVRQAGDAPLRTGRSDKSAPAEKVPPSAANTMIHASMSAPRTSNARMHPSFYFVTSSLQ